MQDIIPATTHRKLCFFVFITCSLILTLSYYDTAKFINYEMFSSNASVDQTSDKILKQLNSPTRSKPVPNYDSLNTSKGWMENFTLIEDTHFLVSSSKCKMINLDPFNKDAKKHFTAQKYKACRSQELLTYVIKKDNNKAAVLHIDQEIVPSYSRKGVTCCYANVSRAINAKHPDSYITLSECKKFTNNVTLHHPVVTVKCREGVHNKVVYENVHAVVTVTDTVQKKIDNFDNTTHPISVLFIGIDSVSRLNFIRALPNTYKYVAENGWLTLNGYNKMDDNTFPNLMAILTGFNQTYAYTVCNPKSLGMLDKCPILWYDYRKLGYVTAYAEDEASINTFNYRKEGFVEPPADYYFRPYVLATEKLPKTNTYGMTYCTGPETAGERIMNLAKDFAVTFQDNPSFGFFWMNSFSHNSLSSVSGMDNKVKSLLVDLENSNVLNRSLVIFLSDHGMRFGAIRVTETGWLEERLPFIYLWFPPWFKEKFPNEYENFKANKHKLTTPYDLHITLQHLLVLSGFNYTITPSDACPKCKSLFDEIESERSCEDAAIEQHWCTCTGYKEVTLRGETQANVTNFILNEIQQILNKYSSKEASEKKCAKYTVEQVLSTSISQTETFKKQNSLLVKIETNPTAVFETTVMYSGDINNSSFSLSGGISRLDYYSDHSKCVNDAFLKMYCYCR